MPFATAGVPPMLTGAGACHSGAHVFPAAVAEQFADPAAPNANSPEYPVPTYTIPPATAGGEPVEPAPAGIAPVHNEAHVFPVAVAEQFADPAASNAYSDPFAMYRTPPATAGEPSLPDEEGRPVVVHIGTQMTGVPEQPFFPAVSNAATSAPPWLSGSPSPSPGT